MKVIMKSLLVWLLIIPLAVLNGMGRRCALEPLLGRYALPASGITLCMLVLALTWLCIRRVGVSAPRQLAVIGFVWAVLAMVFEGVLGLALRRTVADLVAAYDITSGNLWLLVVVCVGCAPWVAAKIRKLV